MPAAGEPLGNTEYALGVIDDVAELADTGRDGAHPPGRNRQPEGLADHLSVLFENAGTEQVPLRRDAGRVKLAAGGGEDFADAKLAGPILWPVGHASAGTPRALRDSQ